MSGGYRGYIASRPFGGERVAQHIQNLVVRDYAQRKCLPFLLSATEYAMPGCYMILQQVIDEELPSLDGIIAYSLLMLPEDTDKRGALWDAVLSQGKSLHLAHEGLVVTRRADVARIEDILLVRRILESTGGLSWDSSTAR